MNVMNLMGAKTVAPAVVESAVASELKSLNDRQFLDFDVSRVQVLTLDQLERTEKENDSYGNPLKGIYHFDLINKVQEMCSAHGYETEIYDLFAANNKDRNTPGVSRLPMKEAQFGERAIEAHILRRVFCNIRLKDFDAGTGDNAITTNMAISFQQRGIQVAIGRNVCICHNQCLLSPEHYAATYSDGNKRRSMDVNGILAQANDWLDNLRGIVADNDEKIAQMKMREIEAREMFTFIGMLTALRVSAETKYKEIRNSQIIPLNQAQIGKLTEKMMIAYTIKGCVTAWDLYNAATDMYKSITLDQPMILSQNLAMSNFIETNIL